MVQVRLWGSLRPLAGGDEVLELEARNLQEVLERIATRHPALKPQIRRGVSFAVDGVIFRDAWFTPVSGEQEIVMMPYMVGG